jgi:hypothetical protein
MNTAPLPPLDLDAMPEIDLRHLLVLTDDTAMLQHATHATPNLHHGYCTDDNARALIAGVLYCDLLPEVRTPAGGPPVVPDELVVAMQRYLAFLSYAFHPEAGRFKNFMDYDRSWAEVTGSEDSHARALWGLGVAVRRGRLADIQNLADALFTKALPAAAKLHWIRPWAYVLLGVEEYLRSSREAPEAARVREAFAGRLFEMWRANATGDWPWWEDQLTWGNAKLPHAMLICGASLSRDDMVEAALTALRWLLEVQTGEAGRLSIIGNRGWFRRGGERARFDQQPIEAKGLVQACLAAAYLTREAFWTKQAVRCFEWFRGGNDLGAVMYNEETGGCYDGLAEDGAAANQGAESTLAYLLSVLELHAYARAQRASEDLSPRGSAKG